MNYFIYFLYLFDIITIVFSLISFFSLSFPSSLPLLSSSSVLSSLLSSSYSTSYSYCFVLPRKTKKSQDHLKDFATSLESDICPRSLFILLGKRFVNKSMYTSINIGVLLFIGLAEKESPCVYILTKLKIVYISLNICRYLHSC